MRLERRHALVTGGANGIGAATARRLAAEGARVTLADLNLDGARAVAGEIGGYAVAMDVADTASVREAVADATTQLGAVELRPIETPVLAGAELVHGEIGRRLKEGMVAATALRRIGMPDEVAAAIAFLAGDDASYVTGQTLNVSGGLSM